MVNLRFQKKCGNSTLTKGNFWPTNGEYLRTLNSKNNYAYHFIQRSTLKNVTLIIFFVFFVWISENIFYLCDVKKDFGDKQTLVNQMSMNAKYIQVIENINKELMASEISGNLGLHASTFGVTSFVVYYKGKQ